MWNIFWGTGRNLERKATPISICYRNKKTQICKYEGKQVIGLNDFDIFWPLGCPEYSKRNSGLFKWRIYVWSIRGRFVWKKHATSNDFSEMQFLWMNHSADYLMTYCKCYFYVGSSFYDLLEAIAHFSYTRVRHIFQSPLFQFYSVFRQNVSNIALTKMNNKRWNKFCLS